VDILLREADADRATVALANAGFHRAKVFDVTMFPDDPDGKPSQAVHILWAGQKVKSDYVSPVPSVEDCQRMQGKRIIGLVEMVRMKLLSNRDKDRVHLRDMIGVGLIDSHWPELFEPPLNERLQVLLDDPNG
jgi:hypothetical protein